MTGSNVERLRQAYQVWHDTRGADFTLWLAPFDDNPSVLSLADGAPGMRFSARAGA